jgi:hypothetical protein
LVLGRYCIPSTEALRNVNISNFYGNFTTYFDVNKITNYVSDVFAVWYVLLICVGIAFALGFIYMIVLRCCASVLVFFTLMAVLCALGGGGVWLYFFKDHYETTAKNYKYCEYGAYVLWGLAGAYLLILLCLCKRIRLGVAIIKCTAQFIGSTPSVFFIPLFFVIFIGAWIAGWAFSAVYLFSVGEIKPRDAPL